MRKQRYQATNFTVWWCQICISLFQLLPIITWNEILECKHLAHKIILIIFMIFKFNYFTLSIPLCWSHCVERMANIWSFEIEMCSTNSDKTFFISWGVLIPSVWAKGDGSSSSDAHISDFKGYFPEQATQLRIKVNELRILQVFLEQKK